ncbi:dihydrofolate reductase [Inquilinus sp. KBS0705]|nr:dihydrofolate reductase [Inquilinus sp. KBS0705]
MRKIILNLAVSLDGFIEGPNGEYDWCLTDQDYGMDAFFENCDTIFIGRKSYELISTDTSIFPVEQIYVFSDTLPEEQGMNVSVVKSYEFDDTVERVMNEPGKNIWLFGGAELLSAFLNKNLIGEMILSIHPILLGAGKNLFKNLNDRVELIFISQQTYSSGLLQAKYALKPKFDMDMLAKL